MVLVELRESGMRLFNRQSKQNISDTAVPPEVHEYYQAERRGRIGTAWLLSAATFVGTVLVVLGLFYGGRWIYRSTAGNKKPNTQTQQVSSSVKQESSKSSSGSSQSGSQNSSNPTPPPSTPTPPPAASTPAPTPPAPAPSSAMPNTGVGATAAIGLFATVSTFGTIAYQIYYRNRLAA
jgi:cytoskeletal protein RodZ